MYVPGKISNNEKILVDIGTGYFVEKSLTEAKDFIKRKYDYVHGNADKVEQIIDTNQQNIETVAMVLERKMEIQKQQQAAAASTAQK